jgi:hypothetical protein
MPNFKDIFANDWLGFWSFVIIAAGIVLFWGLLFIFNQHHRMKPPKARIIIAGGAFIAFVLLWFFLTGFARICHELNDVRSASVRRENFGLEAGVISAYPVKETGTATNYDASEITAQSMTLSPENRKLQSGIDIGEVLHIANAGDPTTIWDCQTYIILPGGKEMDASMPSLLVTTNQTVPSVIGLIKITKENFLLNALSTTPLATGAAGNYWIEIHVNGINEIPAGTHVFVTFHDVYNRPTVIDYMWEPGA